MRKWWKCEGSLEGDIARADVRGALDRPMILERSDSIRSFRRLEQSQGPSAPEGDLGSDGAAGSEDAADEGRDRLRAGVADGCDHDAHAGADQHHLPKWHQRREEADGLDNTGPGSLAFREHGLLDRLILRPHFGSGDFGQATQSLLRGPTAIDNNSLEFRELGSGS